jgi:hypothetical protein
MDGGRVLRSILAARRGLLTATRVAVIVTGCMVPVYCAAGFAIGSPFLAFIGLFICFAGIQELFALEMRERGRAMDAGEEIPIVIPVNPRPTPWRTVPPSLVTVYVWDAQKSEWIKQGVVGQG